MESGYLPQLPSEVKCCDHGCSSCSTMNETFSETSLRSVKRKLDDTQEENKFTVPGLAPQNARVEIENECMELRETVANQQQTIQDLIMELEEERNASSSATNEAMSMILRLQREKAEVQMEARQFKRFAEEKMEHDRQEILALEDMLYKREQTLQALACEVHAYKQRMMNSGLTEAEADGYKGMSRNMSLAENLEEKYDDFLSWEMYPPLKCNTNEPQVYPDGDDETADIEKYPFLETPHSRDQLKDLEYRISELEQSPRTIEAVVGQSPRQHLRKFSTDSSNAQFAMTKEIGSDHSTDSPRFGGSVSKTVFSHLDLNPDFRKVDTASEVGDDANDRIYTIDSIHQGPPANGVADHKASSPRDSLIHSDVSDLEVQKLYARIQALEADRESMRQSLISVGTDKAQLMLLKEIAQNLCKEMAPSRVMPVQKKPVTKSFSFISLFKWIISFLLLRRKARRSKYTFGMSAKNEGLLMLLDRGPRIGQWRVASSTIKMRN